MTAALVVGQEASAEGAGSSFGVAFSSDTIAGNMIIASSAVWEDAGDELSALITDTQSNLYIIAASATREGTGGEESRIELQYAFNIAGGATTVNSVDLGSNTFRSLIISEWTGVSVSDPLDPSVNSADGDSTAPNAGEITPTGNVLYIGCGCYEGDEPTVTAGGGYTKLATEITSGDRAPNYVLYAIGSGAKTAQATLSTSLQWTIASAAFAEGGNEVRSQVVAPFMPKIIDLIFRVPSFVTLEIEGLAPVQDGGRQNSTWSDSGFASNAAYTDSALTLSPSWRWDLDDIPENATIISATILIKNNGGSSGSQPIYRFNANDVADCPTLDDLNNGSTWTPTSATVDIEFPLLDGPANEGRRDGDDPYLVGDIKTIIQELLDSYGTDLKKVGITMDWVGGDTGFTGTGLLFTDQECELNIIYTVPVHEIDAEVTIYALKVKK